MAEKKIRVVLGDHALNLEGMSALLKGVTTMTIVAAADDPKKLTDAVKKKTPDVVVVDSRMIRSVPKRGINGTSKVIQIADGDAYVTPTPATKGIVRRSEGSKGLKDAIRRVARGETYAMTDTADKGYKLSRRELQIAKLVAQGLSNRAIAQEVELSEQSVKNLVSRILKKTRFTNRVQLALAKL